MIPKFHSKSLAFYGGSIIFVLLLFKVVTAYGETNLHAPPALISQYRLNLDQNLNCSQPNPLMLNIQQSGIYLNGSLSVAITETPKIPEKPTLSGMLANRQLSLSGKVRKNVFCPSASANSQESVTIQSQLEGSGTLQGDMTITGIPTPLKFTAVAQKPSVADKAKSH